MLELVGAHLKCSERVIPPCLVTITISLTRNYDHATHNWEGHLKRSHDGFKVARLKDLWGISINGRGVPQAQSFGCDFRQRKDMFALYYCFVDVDQHSDIRYGSEREEVIPLLHHLRTHHASYDKSTYTVDDCPRLISILSAIQENVLRLQDLRIDKRAIISY